MPVAPLTWAKEMAERGQSDITDAVVRGCYYTYLGIWHTLTSRVPTGRNVYDSEWDLLVILDACRVDALRHVMEEYEFLEEVDAVWSRGSGSHEWLGRTFTSSRLDEIRNTAFTTPNGFAEKCFVDGVYPPHHPVPLGSIRNRRVSAREFGLLDFAWTEGWNEDLGTVPPRLMTDRAIHIGRNHDFDRLIVHYYQPHHPYLAGSIWDDRPPTEIEAEPFEHRRNGDIDQSRLWRLYLDNLRLVLDETELLLRNIGADRVALTADHGELLGEFGMYEHPEGVPHPALRKVPWATTTATDERSYEPSSDNIENIGWQSEPGDRQTDEQLRALGYR